jgi:hypothetical protein
MLMQPGRVYVTKKATGAVWSSCMPEQGVWRKEWPGVGHSANTCPVGAVTQGFFPGSRKNRHRFVPGIVHG